MASEAATLLPLIGSLGSFLADMLGSVSSDDVKRVTEGLRKTAPADLPDQDKLVRHLQDAYQREELVLVLGAGISRPYGLPSWNDLISRIFVTLQADQAKLSTHDSADVSALFAKIFPQSPLIAMHQLKQLHDREGKHLWK